MVKGVSKTVIEVKNTGSPFFEKIVFYVTPEYGNLNAKQLKKAAAAFSFNRGSGAAKALRKKAKIRRTVFLSGCGICAFLLICGIVLLIL